MMSNRDARSPDAEILGNLGSRARPALRRRNVAPNRRSSRPMSKGSRVTKRRDCRDVTAVHHVHRRGMGQHAGRHRTGETGGCADGGNRTTIGSDTTQWRNGTCRADVVDQERRGLRHPPGSA